MAAEEGSDVTLHCEVDSNPKPDIVWHHEGSDGVVGKQATFTIPAMRLRDAGRYTCRATVAGFPEITQDVHVYVKGTLHFQRKPTILKPWLPRWGSHIFIQILRFLFSKE